LFGRPRDETDLEEESGSWCQGLLTPLLSLVYLTTYTLHLLLSEKFQLREFQILLGNLPDHAFSFLFSGNLRAKLQKWRSQLCQSLL